MEGVALFKKWLTFLLNKIKKLLLVSKESTHEVVYKVKRVIEPYPPNNCESANCNKSLNIIEGKKCKYCNRYFCIYHLSPAEKHDCKEKLITIPHPFREEYSKGKIIVHSK